jgi:hypothetical protein
MSRSRVLELTQDNAGFASFVEKNKDWFKHKLEMLNFYFNSKYPNFKVFLYGEWCGSGIQKNVAISQVSKKLVLFAVKLVNVDDNEDVYYLKIPKTIECPEREIYNIRKIGTKIIDIDFNKPEVAQNKLIEIVDEVEKECPVGKYFGVEGIGEGIVVSHYNKESVRQHIFKVKGEEHAKNSGKVKVLKPVDEEFEQKKRDFVNDHGCKEWRLDQMYNETFDVINGGKGDIKKTGDYIRKVIKDVMKEEMDILILQGLTPKDVNSTISNVAKHYLFSRLDQESGLIEEEFQVHNKVFIPSDRDYKDDFEENNSHYVHCCTECKMLFEGHKYRKKCSLCFKQEIVNSTYRR